MTPWKLKRTAQCEKCPWRKATNPREIPNGYTEERHRALEQTIAQGIDLDFSAPLKIMACHEMEETHCIGWLVHQLGPGNNIRMRIAMMGCTNARKIRLRGPQHSTFQATLPCPEV